MKTARERARLALEVARDPTFQTERDRLDEIALLFKEFARDQHYLCAEAVRGCDGGHATMVKAHSAVMNTPFPGE